MAQDSQPFSPLYYQPSHSSPSASQTTSPETSPPIPIRSGSRSGDGGGGGGGDAYSPALSFPVPHPHERTDSHAPFHAKDDLESHADAGPGEGGTHVSRKQRHALPSRLEKLYMAVAATEALAVFVIAFTTFGLIQVNLKAHNAKVRTVPVYLAIFIMAQIFSVIYVFDALRGRNIVQLGLHLFFNICIMTYSILQIPQTKNALEGQTAPGACGSFPRCTGPDSLFNLLQKLFLVVPIILGLANISFATMIRALYVQFGWAVFHVIGASPEMKRMHQAYQTLISLLKMLLFFATALSMAFLILVTAWDRGRAEFIITATALPLVILGVLACAWALRTENKPVMGGCLVLMVAGLAYFVYKLASLWLPPTSSLYSDTKITMAIFAIFAILILLATFINGCICMSNFGKGLIDTHRNPGTRTTLWSLPSHSEKKDEQGMIEVQRVTID